MQDNLKEHLVKQLRAAREGADYLAKFGLVRIGHTRHANLARTNFEFARMWMGKTIGALMGNKDYPYSESLDPENRFVAPAADLATHLDGVEISFGEIFTGTSGESGVQRAKKLRQILSASCKDVAELRGMCNPATESELGRGHLSAHECLTQVLLFMNNAVMSVGMEVADMLADGRDGAIPLGLKNDQKPWVPIQNDLLNGSLPPQIFNPATEGIQGPVGPVGEGLLKGPIGVKGPPGPPADLILRLPDSEKDLPAYRAQVPLTPAEAYPSSSDPAPSTTEAPTETPLTTSTPTTPSTHSSVVTANPGMPSTTQDTPSTSTEPEATTLNSASEPAASSSPELTLSITEATEKTTPSFSKGEESTDTKESNTSPEVLTRAFSSVNLSDRSSESPNYMSSTPSKLQTENLTPTSDGLKQDFQSNTDTLPISETSTETISTTASSQSQPFEHLTFGEMLPLVHDTGGEEPTAAATEDVEATSSSSTEDSPVTTSNELPDSLESARLTASTTSASTSTSPSSPTQESASSTTSTTGNEPELSSSTEQTPPKKDWFDKINPDYFDNATEIKANKKGEVKTKKSGRKTDD